MPRVEITRHIQAPVEAIWQCLNDIDHTAEWVVGLERAEMITTGPYGEGSEYIDYNRLGPVLQKTLWRVTAFDPMSYQVHISESKSLPSTLSFSLTPEEDGTAVRMTIDYRFLPGLGPLSRLLESLLMQRALPQVIQQNLANLERYLSQNDGQPD